MPDLSIETIRAVNLVMLIFCSIEAVIVLLNSPPIFQRTRSSRIFSFEMILIVLAVFCYTLGLILELGQEGIVSVIMRAAAYIGVYVILYFHALYVRENINLSDVRTPVSDKVNRIALALCVIGSVLWLLTVFDPRHEHIDEPTGLGNVNFWIGYIAGFILILMIGYMLLIHRRTLGIRRITVLSALPILLMISIILEETVLHGIILRYPAISIGLVIIYTYHHMEIEYKYKKEEAEHLQNRMNMATARMNPHYIYNVLTSIYYLCETDPTKAQHAIGMFSEYLRNTLDTIEKMELVDFNWELDVIKNYLTLEELRFGDRIRVEYDIEFDNFRIPPLSIQPLVENAVKHGLAPLQEGGSVRIVTRKLSDGGVQIRVIDDGLGFNVAVLKTLEITNAGLANVKERLRMEVGGDLTITSAPGKGTTATVTIRPDGAENSML